MTPPMLPRPADAADLDSLASLAAAAAGDADRYHGLPPGTRVHWAYRSAQGDGRVQGVATPGPTRAKTKYSLRELDHHQGEPDVVYHWGSNLKRGWVNHHPDGSPIEHGK